MIQITINELVNNKEKYQSIKNNLDKCMTKDASTIIYEKIKDLVK